MKKFTKLNSFLFYFLSINLFSSAVNAEIIDIITGSVIDKKGRPVSEYDVDIKNLETEKSYNLITDDGGVFELYRIETGDYEVIIVDPLGEQKKVITLNADSRAIGEFKLNHIIEVSVNKDAKTTISKSVRDVINPEAAQTINAKAARYISPGAAKAINAQAARTITPEAARVISPEVARVLHPERAKNLTEEQAKKLTIEEASTPPDK